jgi:sec-independent protein translocase protein TatC
MVPMNEANAAAESPPNTALPEAEDGGPPLGIRPFGATVARGLHTTAGGEGGDEGAAGPAVQLATPHQVDLENLEAERLRRELSPMPPHAGDEAAAPLPIEPPAGGPPENDDPGAASGDEPPADGGGAGRGEGELDLFEHLRELRSRLLKSFTAIGVAMIGTWAWREPLLTWFAEPINREIKAAHGTLTTVTPAEGFSLYLQTAFVAAIIIAMPVVFYQLWAFIEPALTKKERRYGIVLVPFSVLLFFVGAVFGFYLTPLFFRFFLQYQPSGSVPYWRYGDAATMLGKMLLCFGICFQVPVVTIFVNKIGLVSRNWMIEYWRHVVVIMFIVVAIITPTWDPLTLCVAAVPPCLLYWLSIWLVKWL